MDRKDLKDIQLRLLNELANLRTESKRARQRLMAARSGLAEVNAEMEMLQDALRLEAVLQFPLPVVEIKPVLKVVEPAEKKVLGTG